MNSRYLFLVFALWALAFQGCNDVYTTDFLERSSSLVTFPLAGVRAPPSGDSGVMIQASFALKAQISGPQPVVLNQGSGSSESGYSIQTTGATSTVTMPGAQGSGMVNLWVNPRLRFGLATDVSSLGGTFGAEAAMRLGDPLSIEVFAGTGIANSNTSADWRIQRDDPYGDGTTNKWESRHSHRSGGYGLLGCHLGARHDGPWVEAMVLKQMLFDAWTHKTGISLNAAAVGAGWSIFTEYGVATLFGRSMYMGQEWTPSAGIQFTICLGMPDSPYGRGDYPTSNRWKGAMPP